MRRHSYQIDTNRPNNATKTANALNDQANTRIDLSTIIPHADLTSSTEKPGDKQKCERALNQLSRELPTVTKFIDRCIENELESEKDKNRGKGSGEKNQQVKARPAYAETQSVVSYRFENLLRLKRFIKKLIPNPNLCLFY
jgi:hypothetical protein